MRRAGRLIGPLPALGENPLYFEVLEEVSYPNRRGFDAVVRLNPGGPPRRIAPGDHDLYGRVVGWVVRGKARFVEANRPTIQGTAIVEN